MQHLRRFSVLLISTLSITGCHHRSKVSFPPPQAEAPIITTLPPMPPLTFPNVELAEPMPLTLPQPATPKLPPVNVEKVRRPHPRPRPEPKEDQAKQPAKTVTGAVVLGQLSADDATTNPHQDENTKDLIQSTQSRVKQLSGPQQAQHKEALAQIQSFLAQARQAWSMNDMVGAQTLANKAKIMLDELLK